MGQRRASVDQSERVRFIAVSGQETCASLVAAFSHKRTSLDNTFSPLPLNNRSGSDGGK